MLASRQAARRGGKVGGKPPHRARGPSRGPRGGPRGSGGRFGSGVCGAAESATSALAATPMAAARMLGPRASAGVGWPAHKPRPSALAWIPRIPSGPRAPSALADHGRSRGLAGGEGPPSNFAARRGALCGAARTLGFRLASCRVRPFNWLLFPPPRVLDCRVIGSQPHPVSATAPATCVPGIPKRLVSIPARGRPGVPRRRGLRHAAARGAGRGGAAGAKFGAPLPRSRGK